VYQGLHDLVEAFGLGLPSLISVRLLKDTSPCKSIETFIFQSNDASPLMDRICSSLSYLCLG
jgi:hypothetical protein